MWLSVLLGVQVSWAVFIKVYFRKTPGCWKTKFCTENEYHLIVAKPATSQVLLDDTLHAGLELLTCTSPLGLHQPGEGKLPASVPPFEALPSVFLQILFPQKAGKNMKCGGFLQKAQNWMLHTLLSGSALKNSSKNITSGDRLTITFPQQLM